MRSIVFDIKNRSFHFVSLHFVGGHIMLGLRGKLLGMRRNDQPLDRCLRHIISYQKVTCSMSHDAVLLRPTRRLTSG